MKVLRQLAEQFGVNAQPARCGPIGVDIALEKLHLVQLQDRGDGRPALRARASVPFPCSRDALIASPAALRKVIRRGLDSDRFKGRRASIAMPACSFHTRSLEYQIAAGCDEDEVVGAHLAQQLDGDLDDYLIDYLPLAVIDGSTTRRALVSVSPRMAATRYVETVRMAGLRVSGVEIGPTAIRRLVAALPSDGDSDVALVINTGWRRSYLTLVAGTRLLFDQPIAFSEERLLALASGELGLAVRDAREMAMRYGLDPACAAGEAMAGSTRVEFDALLEGIQEAYCMVAAMSSGAQIKRIYLLGSIARWPGADSALSAIAGLPVNNMPNPLSLMAADGGFADATMDELIPEVAVATGLALRGFERSVRSA